MNETKTIYRIPERNLATLQNEIARLNKRAARLGVPLIVLRETGSVETVEKKSQDTGLVVSVTHIIEIELLGATPKFDGWTLAATLEHTQEGNIIRKVPACPVDLMPWANSKPACEHCKTARNRRDTYLVAHDDGTVKQVGHDCIRDFLGHKCPQQLAAMAELLFSAGELCSLGENDGFEGGCREKPYVYTRTLLGYTARAVRQFGFVTRKSQDEAEMSGSYRPSTKNTVLAWMFPPRDESARARIAQSVCLEGEKWPTPSEADKALVDAAREYVIETLGTHTFALSEFENNLLICAKLEAIEERTAGIACYIIEYYRRATEKAAELAKRNNTHFGEVGKRYKEVTLRYVGCSSFDSAYGMCFIHRFNNEAGQALVWKTSSALGYADGAELRATFTVKAHDEYKGAAQTKISRAVIL